LHHLIVLHARDVASFVDIYHFLPIAVHVVVRALIGVNVDNLGELADVDADTARVRLCIVI